MSGDKPQQLSEEQIKQSHQNIETVLDLNNPNAEKPPEVEVEVVDDTPPPDRNRGRKPDAKESEKPIPDDDEIALYGENVQKRLKRMKFEYHEERRGKEAIGRQLDEATKLLQQFYEENKRLKSTVSGGAKILAEQAKGRVDAEIENIKSRMKKAHEDGNTEDFIKAQDDLANLHAQKREVANFRPPEVQAEPQRQQPVAQPVDQRPAEDPKAKAWASKNEDWFQRDDEMTGYVYGLHTKLVKDGINPQSDEYYAKIDAQMRKRFADFEWDDEPPPAKEPAKPVRQTMQSMVAPASRAAAPANGATGPKKVQLTASQVSIARRLGITPEQYAVEMLREMNKNG